jgi:hypothetical protein
MFQIPLLDICSKSWILKILKYAQLALNRRIAEKETREKSTNASRWPAASPFSRDNLPFAFFIVRTTRKGGLLERRGEEKKKDPNRVFAYYCNVGNPSPPKVCPSRALLVVHPPPTQGVMHTHKYKYSEGEVRGCASLVAEIK